MALQALLVFILYVRCTAINPADPGILSKFDNQAIDKPNTKHGLSAKDLPTKFDEIGNGPQSSPSSASRSSIAAANSSRKGSVGEVGKVDIPVKSPSRKSSCCNFGGIFCALFVHKDCRKQEGTAEQQGAGEDALFCTLCNAEVIFYCMSIYLCKLEVLSSSKLYLINTTLFLMDAMVFL